MTAYGVAEAKNKFTHLLERVERGETIVITRHGKPVAEIVKTMAPPRPVRSAEFIEAALERLRQVRESLPPANKSAAQIIREMRDEGF